MPERTVSSKNLILYIGLVLLLTGTLAARGQDMIILLLGGAALLVLEVVEFQNISPERAVVAQLILSSAFLLVSIIKIVESIGSRFAAHHFYLMIMLSGVVLILIEDVKRYTSSEARRIYTASIKPQKTGS